MYILTKNKVSFILAKGLSLPAKDVRLRAPVWHHMVVFGNENVCDQEGYENLLVLIISPLRLLQISFVFSNCKALLRNSRRYDNSHLKIASSDVTAPLRAPDCQIYNADYFS